ncbi:aminotransferase class V-fold PLP-dependent enzyme [Micromonospora sp. NPDC003776]
MNSDLVPFPLERLLSLPIVEQFPGIRPAVAQLDGPGGTLVHRAVSTAMRQYLTGAHFGGAWPDTPHGLRNRMIVEWASGRIRTLIGAAGGTVTFGSNMTALTILFVRSIAPELRAGDEIICTQLDHTSNVAPWLAAARETNAVVRMATLSPTGELEAATVVAMITPRTRWIAVTGGSNALGSAPDVAAICAVARTAGVRTFVDGVQAVAHRDVNVDTWQCDAFVTSPDKWYGPHGGVLWTRDEPPVRYPAELARSYSVGLQPGTVNIEAVLGAGVAADVLLGWDLPAVFGHGRRLRRLLVDGLHKIEQVRVLGPPSDAPSIPIVTFQVPGRPAADVARALAAGGVTVCHGTFSAEAALRAVSPQEPRAVRAGIARYTTREEIRTLVQSVAAFATS